MNEPANDIPAPLSELESFTLPYQDPAGRAGEIGCWIDGWVDQNGVPQPVDTPPTLCIFVADADGHIDSEPRATIPLTKGTVDQLATIIGQLQRSVHGKHARHPLVARIVDSPRTHAIAWVLVALLMVSRMW